MRPTTNAVSTLWKALIILQFLPQSPQVSYHQNSLCSQNLCVHVFQRAFPLNRFPWHAPQWQRHQVKLTQQMAWGMWRNGGITFLLKSDCRLLPKTEQLLFDGEMLIIMWIANSGVLWLRLENAPSDKMFQYYRTVPNTLCISMIFHPDVCWLLTPFCVMVLCSESVKYL